MSKDTDKYTKEALENLIQQSTDHEEQKSYKELMQKLVQQDDMNQDPQKDGFRYDYDDSSDLRN